MRYKLCGGRLALDFIELSHQEALFQMGIQAARYEKATRGCPDCAAAYNSLIKSDGEECPKKNATKLSSALGQKVEQPGWTLILCSSVML